MGTSTPPLIVLKEIAGHSAPTLSPLQSILAPHVELITQFWVAVWWVTAGVLLYTLWREYRTHTASKHDSEHTA